MITIYRIAKEAENIESRKLLKSGRKISIRSIKKESTKNGEGDNMVEYEEGTKLNQEDGKLGKN